MDKRIYICAAFILFILLGLIAYNYLEIYPRKRYTYFSREVISNNYYALERWLKETGHEVISAVEFNPAAHKESKVNTVIIEPETYFWDFCIDETILWIEQGGFLVLCLDNSSVYYRFEEFLSDLGITIEKILRPQTDLEYDAQYPDFDRTISFKVDKENNIYLMNDSAGITRLIEVPLKNGILTVTGSPLFMYNHNIAREENAYLSWRLTGGRAEETKVLFIRPEHDFFSRGAIFGPIMERGNIVPAGISLFILIITGFWMVIPVFGLIFPDKQRNSRPIKDRFSAEINFLKKHRALNYYLDVYERERNKGTENNQQSISENKTYKYRELINQYRSIFNGTAKF
jgi:hypothetical protein